VYGGSKVHVLTFAPGFEEKEKGLNKEADFASKQGQHNALCTHLKLPNRNSATVFGVG